jgi:hypothetical protein
MTIVVAFLGVGPMVTSSAFATSSTVPACSAASVRVVDYNTVVGAGNVNDLIWIENVSSERCSLRGYVRTAYIGNYGQKPTSKVGHLLVVAEADSPGRDGNDLGGVKRGVKLPTVTLLPRTGRASFWIYGTDIQHGSPPSRCIISFKMLVWLPGSARAVSVRPMRSNGFFWCGAISVHPIVPGVSGSDPSVPLPYYFGVAG